MRLGLTGGIGAGKSEVAATFAALGALVIDTDALAREAVAPGTLGLAQIAGAWPQVITGGVLDRAALAEIVFADPVARERLDRILHPLIRRLALERESRARPGQLVVHVVPLLFESGYDAFVDQSLVVVAPLDQRVTRIIGRDGIDEARVRARMAAQIPPECARARADFVIENDGDLEHLRARTRMVYEKLR